jgi:TonB-linked SusC/RagA family outer membrane protein
MNTSLSAATDNGLNSDLNNATEQQQGIEVSGTIKDANGETLPGVSVIVKESGVGTATDFDGNYTIMVEKGQTISASFIGYKTVDIIFDGSATLDITLQEDQEVLDEVVVVGYGTQKKVNLTGSVSAVGGETLAKKTVTDVRQSLQGEAPGVTIVNRGGLPGQEEMSINIRGISSLGAGTQPLVLVDGIEMPMNDVQPSDIASISVLKDAASSAIYGSRAANGVILITTKRGEEGKFSASYEGYFGTQAPASLPELVGRSDYYMLVNEAAVNAGQRPVYNDKYISEATAPGADPYKYPYNNMFDELYNRAPMQYHSLNVVGGSETTKIAFSANYLDQKGMLENVGSKRAGFRLNTDFILGEKFSMSADVNYNNRDSENPNRLGDSYGAMVGSSPVTVLTYPNGAYGLNKDNTSALAALQVSGMNTKKDITLNIKAGFDWKFYDGFVLMGDLSMKDINNTFHNFRSEYDFYSPKDENIIVNSWTPSELTTGSWLEKQINARLLLSYEKTFQDHHVSFLGGVDATESNARYLEGYRRNIYSSDLDELNTGQIEGQKNRGYSEDWALLSFFGRANYDYKGKYLFEAVVRYDGSSRFADGNQWGVFPSFSAGWRISEEDFMDNIDVISNLKLRGSWGQLGNQNIGLWRYTSTVYNDFPYNFGDVPASGYSQWYYANEDITWETSEMLDFGFDLGLWEGKLDVVFDWYQKNTRDVLLVLPISPLTGLGASESNAGVVRNTGWELGITHKNNVNDWFYSIGFNISDVQNEIVDFAGNEPAINGWTIRQEGTPIDALYGYKSGGLFANDQEVLDYLFTKDANGKLVERQVPNRNVKPGDIRLLDLDGDGDVDPDDRYVMGNTIPRYSVGLNGNVEYAGFDFNLVVQGVLKAENYFYGELNEGAAFEVFTTPRQLDRWTPDNLDATFPRLEAGKNINQNPYNDFWIRESAYIRVKNIQLGYSLPTNLIEKVGLSKTRFYVGATNPFTFTNVDKGIDPETYSGRFASYPPVKTLLFGLQVGF